MSVILEVSLLFLVFVFIVAGGFLIKLIVEMSKLVNNADNALTCFRTELEPTMKDVRNSVESIQKMIAKTDNQISDLRKYSGVILGAVGLLLGSVKNFSGGFVKGLMSVFNLFKK